MSSTHSTSTRILWAGDLVTYGIVTLAGFTSHGTLESAATMRMLATFVPFYISWLIFSSWGGVHRRMTNAGISWLALSGLAAFLSAPLGATLRGFWLGTPILPTFVLVMGLVSTLGILVWRGIYWKVFQGRVNG